MRILVLTQYYPPEVGAAQARLSAFARELARAGHDVEVVTAFPNYPSGRLTESDRRRVTQRDEVDGTQVRRIWHFTATGAGVKRLASYLSFTASGLVASLATRRANVVFTESPPLFLGLAGWVTAKRFGAAFILNVSDLWPDSIRDLGLMSDGMALTAAEALERWLYARATAVTAVTEGIRTRLIEGKNVPADKVLFLPNGADTEVFRPEPVTTATPVAGLPAGPFVMYAGNFGLAQGLHTLIRAATHGSAKVVLVGGGSDSDRLKSIVRLESNDNVLFLDARPPAEISTMYAQSVAGVVSLRDSPLMEGARPAKTLAIMACGKPVIYAGRGEGAELVTSAEAGVVVPPESPAALAEAIHDLVRDPERAARLGANGRRYVEAHFSWETLTADWLSQLRERLG